MDRTPKVKIGQAYQPTRFEQRGTSGRLSALRPALTDDELTLQSALLARETRMARFSRWVVNNYPESYVGVLMAIFALTLAVLVMVGVVE